MDLRKGFVAFVLAGAGMLVFGNATADASHAPGLVVAQQWELLAESPSVTASGSSEIVRGVLPGGTSGMDPAPSATLWVVGKHTGGTGTSSWSVRLRDAYDGYLFGTVTFSASDNVYTSRSVSLTWPSSTRNLSSLEWSKANGSGVAGTLEIRKAFVRLSQSGAIKKTIARFPLGTKQAAVTDVSYQDLLDPMYYKHVATDFSGTLTARLRASGSASGVTYYVQLVDCGVSSCTGAGSGVSGSELSFTSTASVSKQSGALTLVDGHLYKAQVHISSGGGAGPQGESAGAGTGEASSIELLLEQVATDATHGLSKTVSFFPGVTSAQAITGNGQWLGFLMNSPTATSPAVSGTWQTLVKRNGSSGSVAVNLEATGGGPVASPAVTASSTYSLQVDAPATLPTGAPALDSRAVTVGAGTTGRIAMSVLRLKQTLHDTAIPTITGFGVSGSSSPFSPKNLDGVRDAVTFSGSLNDSYSPPLSWTLQVKQGTTLIKEMVGTGPAGQLSHTPSLSWDGKKTDGSWADDGTYSAFLTATDGAGNLSNLASVTNQIVVDNIAPSVPVLSVSQDPFSPNGDTRKDSTTISASWVESVATSSLTIYKPDGTPWNTTAGSATSISKLWNTSTLWEGVHTARLSLTDAAGNTGLGVVRNVTVDLTAPSLASLSWSKLFFSPTGSGPTSSTLSGSFESVASWVLSIKNSSNVEVRNASGSGASISYVWNGRETTSGTSPALPDDLYTASLTLEDAAGNQLIPTRTTRIDKVRPTISGWGVSGSPFSPKPSGGPSVTLSGTTSDVYASPISWTIKVLDGATPVRTITGTGGTGVLTLPISRTWDGKDDGGSVVADGTYSAQLTTKDAAGNSSLVSSVNVIVDTLAPVVSSLGVATDPFSPNYPTGDGRRDTTQVTGSWTESVPWVLEFKRPDGTVAKSVSGSGTGLSNTWNGRDSGGSPVVDGTASIKLTLTDLAGNVGTGTVTVVIDTLAPTISSIAWSEPAFSPNGDGVKPDSTLSSSFGESLSWTLTVKDPQGGTIDGDLGYGSSIEPFVFDGLVSPGVPRADGLYAGEVVIEDVAENRTIAAPQVRLDVTAPTLGVLGASDPAFSPESSIGVKDTTTLLASQSDLSYPLSWTMQVTDGLGLPVKDGTGSVTGAGGSISWLWDGENDLGLPVGDGTYQAIVEVIDAAGMTTPSNEMTLVIDSIAPTVDAVVPDPDVISPNGDDLFDASHVEAGGTDALPLAWSVRVLDGQVAKRAFAGSGGTALADWDGEDALGNVAADGTYDVEVAFTDAAGNTAIPDLADVRVDTLAPSITSSGFAPAVFSPNGDPNADTATLTAALADLSTPITWTLQISNHAGQVVESFTGSGAVDVTWDGLDAQNEPFPDGVYTATVEAIDAVVNDALATFAVQLDLSTPEISNLVASNPAFSPNGDGSKDSTTITATLNDAAAPLTWTATVRNDLDLVVRSVSDTLSSSPANLSWEWTGTTDEDLPLLDGAYTVALAVADSVGNSSVEASIPVVLDRVAPTVSTIRQSLEAFSPSGDGQFETTDITATGSDPASPLSWAIHAKDRSDVLRAFTGTGPDAAATWDGTRASTGLVVDDGDYQVEVAFTDFAGNTATPSTTVTVDTTGPVIDALAWSQTRISPNDDGWHDTATVSGTLSDDRMPLSWSIGVESASGAPAGSTTGNGGSASMSWSGKDGEVAFADGWYEASLEALDALANPSTGTASIYLDLTAPSIADLAASNPRFSPNDDDAKDTTTVTAAVADITTPVTWTATITGPAGLEAAAFSGTGDPSMLWDGLNLLGLAYDDGDYTLHLGVEDAERIATEVTLPLVIDTVAPSIDPLDASPEIFRNTGDQTQITTTLTDPSLPLSWQTSIQGDPGLVRTFTGTGANVSQAWNGLDENAQRVADGSYQITLAATDFAGNVASVMTSVRIDTTIPVLGSLAWNVPRFSPNGDDTFDTATLSGAFTDASALTWTASIQNAAHTEVASFADTGGSFDQLWTGLDASDVVFADGVYEAIVRVTDEVGNLLEVTRSVTIDVAAPLITSLAASELFFSPDGDGVKDVSNLSAQISDPALPLDWSLRAFDAQDALVGQGSGVRQTAGQISWTWNGKDADLARLADGSYQVVARVVDAVGNVATSLPIAIVIDATDPTVTIPAATPALFSPNGDGRRETTVLSATATDQTSLTWALTVGSGATQRQFTGIGGAIDATWNGRTTSGGAFADGTHPVVVQVTDAAGNTTTPAAGSVTIDTVAPTISSLAFSRSAFSPNSDGYKDTATLNGTVSEPVGWTLSIRRGTDAPAVATTGPGSSISYLWTGLTGTPPVAVPEGTYTATILVSDIAENQRTASATTIIDITIPVVTVSVNNPAFSPNGDGVKDTTLPSYTTNEPLVAPGYQIANASGAPVRSFSVGGAWDGKNDSLALQPDGHYLLSIRSNGGLPEDAAGNRINPAPNLDIILDTIAPAITSLGVSEPYFSPNDDTVKDTTHLDATIVEALSGLSWDVSVVDPAGTEVRAASGTNLPDWSWDGKDSLGVVVPEDLYELTLKMLDDAGNDSDATTQATVDLTAPTAPGIVPFPNPFSPTDPPPQDVVTIETEIPDAESWTVRITTPSGGEVRSFVGIGEQVKVAWDGSNAAGAPVPDGPYEAVTGATDAAGNKLSETNWVTVGAGPIIAGVAPAPVEPGGMITITGSGFGAGTEGLSGVLIQGEAAFVRSWSSTEVKVYLPSGLSAGAHELRVWNADLSSSAFPISLTNYIVPEPGPGYEPGKLAFRIKDGADLALITLVHQLGASVKMFQATTGELARWYVSTVVVGDEASKIREVAGNPGVEWAEYVPIARVLSHTTAYPDDPKFPDQWALNSSNDIHVEEAWHQSKGAGTVIGIVDSGVSDHPDLDDKIAGRWAADGLDPSVDGCRLSGSHGTNVASVAAAETDNNRAVAGVAPDAELRAYRIGYDLWNSTKGRYDCGLKSWGPAVEQAKIDGVDVINLSLGGYGRNNDPLDATHAAITAAWNAGIVVVASAGNGCDEQDEDLDPPCNANHPNWDGSGPVYPANYIHVLSVGASNSSGARVTRANTGGSWASNWGQYVDVFAPGTEICAAYDSGAGYGADCTFRGTSAAAPHVAGVAAILKAAVDLPSCPYPPVLAPSPSDIATAISDAIIESAKASETSGHPRPLLADAALDVLEIGKKVCYAEDHPDGTWIKNKDTEAVYLMVGGKRRQVSDAQVLASWGLTVGSPQLVLLTDGQTRRITLDKDPATGKPREVGFRPGTLVRPKGSVSVYAAYIITTDGPEGATSRSRWLMGRREGLTSLDLICLGYRSEAIIDADPAAIERHPEQAPRARCSPLPGSEIVYPSGSILQRQYGGQGPNPYPAWLIEGGALRDVTPIRLQQNWGIKLLQIVNSPKGDEYITILYDAGRTRPVLGYKPGTLYRQDDKKHLPVYAITDEGSDYALNARRFVGRIDSDAFECQRFDERAVENDRDIGRHAKHEDMGVLGCA